MDFNTLFPPTVAIVSLIFLYVLASMNKEQNLKEGVIKAKAASRRREKNGQAQRALTNREDIRLYAQIGVSVLVLVFAMIIITSQKFTPDGEKWAYGMIGTIIGYWLNSQSKSR
jgi:hypothetical protein